MGRGNAYEPCHWGLRWSSLWGYETLYWACRKGHAVGRGNAYEPCHWGLRWSSLWGHETLHWVRGWQRQRMGGREKGGGGSGRSENAGRCLFKTRTQHHRMVGTKYSRMEGMCYSKCGSRFSAAHIRVNNLQQFHGWRADVTRNVVLALAPRTFVLKVCNSFTDRGGALLKMWLSP